MTMSGTERFRTLGEVVADDRARLPLGKSGVRKGDRYAIAVNGEGEILLTPLVSIPKRELIVWENERLRNSLALGLVQSAAGETADLGSFAEYLGDDDDDDDEAAE